MKTEYLPSRISVPKEFEEVFSHFYYAHNHTGKEITKTFFPSYQTILIFCFNEKASIRSNQNHLIEIDKCVVLGTIKKSFDYILPCNSEIMVANFKKDAFYRFFGVATANNHIPIHPDSLLKENCFTALWHDLQAIPNTKDRVQYILDFCKPYLTPRTEVIQKLMFIEDESINPIQAVANDLGLSERSIQMKHKMGLGYSAKELHRYHRFLKAIHFIQQNSTQGLKMDWFDIINHCGYYDQSQLIKDFNHFLNLNPTTYLHLQQDICSPL